MPLSLFDLHADTVWAMYRTKEPLGSNSLAISLDGIRTATVWSPALTEAGTLSPLGKTIVSGPGQNFWAHNKAVCGISFAIS